MTEPLQIRPARRTPLHQVEQQYSFQEAAKLLGLGYSTIRNMVDHGQIKPVWKISHKSVRIPASAINQLLESRAV